MVRTDVFVGPPGRAPPFEEANIRDVVLLANAVSVNTNTGSFVLIDHTGKVGWIRR